MDYIQTVLDKLGLEGLPCPIYFTNKHLRFYEMGAFLQSETDCWIEINPSRLFSRLGYDTKGVLEHELIHAARQNFEDSFWEELIAYSVARYSYQRFLGPFLSEKGGRFCLFFIPICLLCGSVFEQNLLCSTLALSCSLIFVLPYIRRYKIFCSLLKNHGFNKVLRMSPETLNALSQMITNHG